jgi:hypothetical protein
MAGGSYWLLTLVAVHQGDRLIDANPARVADVIRRLGKGTAAATYVAGLVALMFVYLIATAIEQLHNNYFFGGVYLLAATTSAMFVATFFFRLLGVWCFASRVEQG